MNERLQINVPSDVAQAIVQRWHERGEEWCKNVANELVDLCRRFDAIPIHIFKARYGLVVEVETKDGCLVMRSTPDPAGATQADIMRILASLGVAPRVHEVIQLPASIWTVLDRVTPGATLVDQPSTLEALAAMLRPMVGEPAPLQATPTLGEWLTSRLQSDDLSDLPQGRSVASRTLREKALHTLHDLTADALPTLCHGDVSRQNVLLASNGRRLLVDPRGVSGEVAYDVAVLATKIEPRAEARERALSLARLVGVDPYRAEGWLDVVDAARV